MIMQFAASRFTYLKCLSKAGGDLVTPSTETGQALASNICSLVVLSHEFGRNILTLITDSDMLETDKERIVAVVQSRVSMGVAQEVALVPSDGKQVHDYFEQYLRQEHLDSMSATNSALDPLVRLRFGAEKCSGNRP